MKKGSYHIAVIAPSFSLFSKVKLKIIFFKDPSILYVLTLGSCSLNSLSFVNYI